MKRLIIFSFGLVFFSTSAAAAGCEHYAGHFDLEGKIGNNRNIGEASAFLPVACTQDRLLFTDLKFRADNLSNREANIGIGGRVQRAEGIAGGYIYFDRKKSGETDKFYNQITTGAEWLADHWETRANVYIPLNGSKTIGSGVVVSDPYLAGTGIFIDRGGFQIKETPMYGADAEIGFQTTKDLWLYGGGFTFHGNDVPTITGARVRARYDLTDKVSLNAEGQYDDERGRQGWLGARLSVPFGNANAARSRMVQSPVRDIDIVTQAKTTFEPQTTTALANPESGDAQRVIYVDNRAAANGDGSLENPYNTLADAQNDLRDYDIVYVFHGDGTTTGQDQGFVIDKNNVSFIGEGSPLTFAGYTLRAAGQRPVITNQQALVDPDDGAGIFATAANVVISGIEINGARRIGISVVSRTGNNGNVVIENIVSNNNASTGVSVNARPGAFDRVVLKDIWVDNSGAQGVSVTVTEGGSVGSITARNIHSFNNNAGVFFSAGALTVGAGEIGRIDAEKIYSSNNDSDALVIRAVSGSGLGSSHIGPVTINGAVLESSRYGLYFFANNGATIEKSDVSNVVMRNNINRGAYIFATSNGSIEDLTIRDSDIVGNQQVGIFFNDDSNTGIYQVKLSENNRIFGNNTSGGSFADVLLDLDGVLVPLDARRNWWGQDSGPLPGQIASEGAGAPPNPNTGSADVDDWLTSDPRP